MSEPAVEPDWWSPNEYRCPGCGISPDRDDLEDVTTPAGPVSVCSACARVLDDARRMLTEGEDA
jgi:hypothetical protein